MEVRAHHLWLLKGVMERYGSVSHIESDFLYQSRATDPRDEVRNVYKSLLENPDSEVKIIDALDVICGGCPNNDGKECTKYTGMKALDDEAIGHFNVAYGKPYTAREIFRKLRSF